MKVKATLSAKKLLSELKAVHGEDLLFHQSGGCCDGSALPSQHPPDWWNNKSSPWTALSSLKSFFADNVAFTFIFYKARGTHGPLYKKF